MKRIITAALIALAVTLGITGSAVAVPSSSAPPEITTLILPDGTTVPLPHVVPPIHFSPMCITGTVSGGQVSITFPVSTTAQANPFGFSGCGEGVNGYTYSWSTGSTSQTTPVSPGQTVSVTVTPCTADLGCGAGPSVTQSATAPTGGGGCTSNCGGGGGGGAVPGVSASASSTSVTAGDLTYLNWTSTNNASGCSITGGGLNASVGSSGTYRTNPINSTTTFYVACFNAYGQSAAVPVTITVTASQTLTDLDGWTETTYNLSGQVTGNRSGSGVSPYQNGGFGQLLSATGCKTVDWYESGHSSSIFNQLVYRFHQTDHWCWNFPSITSESTGVYVSNVDGLTEVYNGVVSGGAQDYYYTWGGSANGGHYSLRQGSFSNCVIKYGCLSTSYPWTKIWLNANGAWTGADGGGAGQ